MRPKKKELESFVGDRPAAAKHFDVSERTILRWFKHYGLFQRKGRGKLDLYKARKIRQKHKDGVSIKDLAKEYNVTFASISRIIQRINYKDPEELADVQVLYNPN